MNKIEQDKLKLSSKKYFETYHNNDDEVSTFDPVNFLYYQCDSINTHISNNNIFACLSEPMCTCSYDCDCDHDEYEKLKKINIDLSSNCSMILSFDLNEQLNTEIKSLKQEFEKTNIKIFQIDESDVKEKTIFYIDRYNSKILFNKYGIEFDIDNTVSTLYPTINVKIYYMQYKEKNEKSYSVFTM